MGIKTIKIETNEVICDQCNKDYTESNESGGMIWMNRAICRQCLRNIPGSVNSEKYLFCPPYLSFRDFVYISRKVMNAEN